MKKLTTTLCALLLFGGTLFPQVTADLTIENQQVVGTDFFFDIYLTRTGTNNLYLGSADFVLTFAVGNFNSPTLSKVGSSPGNCTFVPTDPSGANTFITQINYFDNTAVGILNGNELTINLNGPTPSDQTTFDTRVALIDNSSSTHRLGTFKVSGITNPSGNMNLQWKTSSTLVFTLANSSPFSSSQATINPINPADAPLPVELNSFTAKVIDGKKVELNWITQTEVNNYGFNVERRINEGEWNSITFIEGHGTTNSPKEYSYSDKDLFAGGSKFQYRLKQIDNDGSFEYSDVVEVEIVVNQYELSQNYPNPFNPSTTISFSLPESGNVILKIYNLMGEEIKTLVDGFKDAGIYKVNFNAEELASGMYLYILSTNGFTATKKMLFMK